MLSSRPDLVLLFASPLCHREVPACSGVSPVLCDPLTVSICTGDTHRVSECPTLDRDDGASLLPEPPSDRA